jgi:metallo-beta-lactamase class B
MMFSKAMPGGLIILASVGPVLLRAQAQETKPDSQAVKALIQKTRKAGGPMWSDEVHFFCEAPRPNRPDDPVIAPTQIFDNLYAIGNSGTVAYVIRTTDGLLMIDSLGANQVQTQLLPGFQALGLDPAQVKIILIGHGHADHFGGAPYMQEHFGSKVYISAVDWDLMEHPSANAQQKGPPPVLPKHDQVVAEGQPVVLGDLKVTPVAVPGHTPGSMGYIFPVKDGGKTRMAAIYAGTILTPNIISDQGLATYLQSVKHFQAEAKKAKVEVEIQNHPLMDPIQTKLDKLKARKPGEANPFVVGQAGYQKFLDVMAGCTEVNIARRNP